ncbi:quinone oxidoreductase family protein [Salinigranum halophilum]|uniref:quinone oxidoreductase family protein n=1 Tax=Salinigranum halophilum TaxID=2565931 RepID=UPI001375867F|nr:NADPH:quinone reductase [Salinigranum halophilum]
MLQVEQTDRLTPEADEVLIETNAIGVNPCDVLRRQGLWDDELPLIPGSDITGVVTDVGTHVTAFEPGDRVFGTIPHLNVSGERGDRQGTYASAVVAREDRLATLPDEASFHVGAAVGLVGITAWRALFHFGDLEPGDCCLIHGASGGVGHIATQLASLAGAKTLATAARRNHSTVERLGADTVLDYADGELESKVNAAAPEGVDLILDHRLGEYIQLDIDVAAYGGSIVAIGGNYDQPQILDLTAAIGKDVTIQPMDMFNEPNIDAVLQRLAILLSSGELTAKVDRVFALEDAKEAQRVVEEESVVGKVVLEP